MLCWCNIIVCTIPVVMFVRDGLWVHVLVSLLNLNIHLWSYSRFRALVTRSGCPACAPAPEGHPTPLEKKEVNFAGSVNIATYIIALALIIYSVIQH
jgi:hypothetical protein